METVELFIGIVTLLIGLYYYLIRNFNFWKSCNVVGPKPIPFFGTIKDLMFSKYSIAVYLKKVYEEFPNAPMIGVYTRSEPVLILNDMDQIKNVLIKDFKSFVDRGMRMNEKHLPLNAHLFNLEAKRWRPLRTKLTPVFTSGKLREMFHLLIECANQLDDYLNRVEEMSVDVRDITAKFATDVIGVCAFGLQANALADEESIFRKMGKLIFKTDWKNILKFQIHALSPRLFDLIGHFLVDHGLNQFFLDLTRDTVEYRRKNHINRHDFIDLLMAIKDQPNKIGDIELTDSLMAAQLFVFFIAGFETSSSTMSNCLFELALNHKIRDKLRKEINEELSKTGGVITYEGIKKMDYLDKTVNETLRKYPPVPVIMRKSTTPYTFPETKVSIATGTRIWIPIFAIQRDPKYFPNPDVFDPERFNQDAIESRPHMTFLSFGDGPRNCIGARFGRMQTKVGLVKILQNHTVDVCEKTDKNYELDQNNRGVLGPKPIPLLGNFKDVLMGKISFGEWISIYYKKYDELPMFGMFIRRRPVLIVRDLDLIKDILIRDFSKFPDRGLKTFEKAEPLSQHLVNLEHQKWRPLRNKLSPAFTSGKLKEMFYLLLDCGNNFQRYMEKNVMKDEPIEVRDLTARFTTDVIGTCAFGLQMNAMADEESEFRKMGKDVFSMNTLKIIKFRIREGAPWLYELLAPIMRDNIVTNFFMKIMKDTIEYRRKNNVIKHDFIDQIMELQDHPDKIPEVKLTDSLLTSQLFVFFLAGFETSSTTMSNALYELAQHQDYQNKLRHEIRDVLKENNDSLTYESVKSMKYLDMVFRETLRKYPPAMVLVRRSDCQYTFAGTHLTIPKNTLIMISLMGIHNDPKIYPNPNVFDPERFTPEAIASRHPMSYLAFGDGPRNCIGARLANHQSKVGLIKILERFRVDVCEKTEIPYKINPRGFLLAPLNGIHLKFSKI
ncbi:hypothetical protein PV325_009196 [Microctonus aethiopoides]|nr:hypothetical protein PV325_009196 [Microctonus aethiopoides]